MISGRNFGAERVLLDGAQFTDCTFSGTTFVYFGGKVPELQDCRLHDVHFEFAGPAKNTITFLNQLKGQEIGFAFNAPAAAPVSAQA